MQPAPTAHRPSVRAGRTFGIGALIVAVASLLTTIAGIETAGAQECRRNYYRCSMNKDGVLDPANPGCCWNPLAGKGNINLQTCPSGFYKCDLNRDGKLDPERPGCCLSDVRLKRDIVKLETLSNGIGLYRFRYRWSDQVYVGVMAHEVSAVMPEAIQVGADGYLRVDYDKVGVRFQTWQAWSAGTAGTPLLTAGR